MKLHDTVSRGDIGKVHVVGRVSRWGLAYRLCDGEHLPVDQYEVVGGAPTCLNCLAMCKADKRPEKEADNGR